MKKITYYMYLGTNGTITSPVHLEDVYYINKYRLYPEEGYQLTKDGIHFTSTAFVTADEVNEWYEVESKGQK